MSTTPKKKKPLTTQEKTVSTVAWVLLDFELREERVYLKIVNSADIPLHNLQILIDGPLWALSGTKNLQKLPILKLQSYCAPGKQISIFLDTVESFFHFQKDLGLKFKIIYEYVINKKKYKLAYIIEHNLKALKGLPQDSSICF